MIELRLPQTSEGRRGGKNGEAAQFVKVERDRDEMRKGKGGEEGKKRRNHQMEHRNILKRRI